MPFFLLFFGIPFTLLLFALAAVAKWIKAEHYVDGLRVGIPGGVWATIAYDAVRAVIQHTRPFGYSGFVPILIFGSWITGQPTTSLAAKVAGWTYHYWNGISFGVMYALMFGKRHWLFAVGYAIVLELCMLGIFPMFVPVSNKVDFVLISLIGHVAYGVILGLYVQKYARYK